VDWASLNANLNHLFIAVLLLDQDGVKWIIVLRIAVINDLLDCTVIEKVDPHKLTSTAMLEFEIIVDFISLVLSKFRGHNHKEVCFSWEIPSKNVLGIFDFVVINVITMLCWVSTDVDEERYFHEFGSHNNSTPGKDVCDILKT